ncbi:MAG: hypothetical protein ACR2NN_14830 [Bryobacteraceae bacterium]
MSVWHLNIPQLVTVTSLFCALSLHAAGPSFTYHIAGDDEGSWPQILSSVGFTPGNGGPTNLLVVRSGAPASAKQWIESIERGSLIVLEGESELAAALGFRATAKRVVVRSITDQHAPKLSIVWEKALDLPIFEVPKEATVFARERWEGAPLMAAIRRGSGAALWIASSPGAQGYERYPYLLQALSDLGLDPPFRSERLWAFFDSAYRSRVDLDYFAARWRKAGIGALQVAGWHYWEPNTEADIYLRKLIEACHRNGILVYIWLELPHVSEKFWADHPDWREKTALLQDAQLDWRKLMNLANPDALAAVRKGTTSLIERFKWDGVNLAELYFESLEGAANPARFTPMNQNIRHEFEKTNGFDPIELFQRPNADAGKLRTFLDYRAGLSRRQQTEWITYIEDLRVAKPDLDLVLTHVDDRFDTGMRDLIGADVTGVLPMLDQHDFTFLIEDPATIWNLGPKRYPEIATRYQPLTKHTGKLAIDINIVERYQDVYPTKLQTGTELFELVHLAAQSFSRVALYFENSILGPDLPLLSAAAASVDKVEQDGNRLVIGSRYGVGIPWQGPATVNGRAWPIRDQSILWLPGGPQIIEPALKDTKAHVIDFNGTLLSASASAKGIELAYRCDSKALALLDTRPLKVDIDGAAAHPELLESGHNFAMMLPRGQHLVTIEVAK